ncbi:Ig-like domain-containing protein, partial [bacterium]|nr:Ig-like domain-containing protein [candidate division CSSED10-310 bacterium]
MRSHRKTAILPMVMISFTVLAVSLITFISCDAPDPTGPAASARITLTATETSLPADGASTTLITAYVKDPTGQAAEGPIYWSTTCGTLDRSSETMTSGVSSVTFTAPNYPCTAIVTADAVHAKKTIEIVCYSIDASDIDVTANPSNIPADGYSKSTISAYVTDERGLPVPDDTAVSFSTTGGTLSADVAYTASGRASVTLTSETVPKDVQVYATVGTRTEYAWVYFYSTQVGRIELRANPSSGIPADGVSYSILTATVYDLSGAPVEDGTTVYFATTWGSLSSSNTTTNQGVATVILYSQL